MCLVQNIKNSLILTKSPTYYIVHGFFQNWPIFDLTKIPTLNTQFERSYKELPNTLSSFEICHS